VTPAAEWRIVLRRYRPVGHVMIGPLRTLDHDPSAAKARVKPGTTARVLALAVPYRWRLALFLLLVVAGSAIAVAIPLLYRTIINDGIVPQRADLVVRLALVAAALALFDAALGLWQTYLAARIGNEILLSLRTRLFAHIQSMPLAFFTRTQTGALVSRLNNDVTGAQTAFTDVLSNVIGNAVSVTMVLGAMFVLSREITFAALVLLPLLIWPARTLGRRLQQITRESFTVAAEMNSVMVERFNVAGAQIAKIFGRPEEDVTAFAAKAARVSAINVRRAVYGRFFFTALTLIASLATVLAYGWGGVLAIRGALDIGTLVALVSYLFRLTVPLTGLSNVQVTIMTALVSFERVFEVLDLPPMITDKPGAVDLPAGAARVAFDRVSFRYPAPAEVSLASLAPIAAPDDRPSGPVLHDVTFTAEPGDMIALVGPSGAGKTTLAHLVARLYDPQSGAVSIDGIDLRDARLESVHQRVGAVTQEPFLFHDSIRANLLYAKRDATEADITAALHAAQILPLVERLPAGLDTVVGDRGHRFSGGEKQRLAIARLLLKAPTIVILDEATAHLDSESEAAIQKALEIALAGRTSIVIAHRLSTILRADQILVVDRGRIVERGRHATLVNAGGLYADLYRRQFADQISAAG
jgi:ATP-binding cassette subfamily B protein